VFEGHAPAGGFATSWGLGFLLLLASCAHGAVAKRPYPAPDPAALLGAIKTRQAAIRGADLETRTTSWLGGDRTRASVYMLVDRQGRLRFEAEAALSGPVATLVANPQTFSLLDLREQRFEHGPACPENIARLIPVALHPQEIAAILLGDVPLAEGARVVGLGWNKALGADVLEIDNPGAQSALTRHLWVSLQHQGPAGGQGPAGAANAGGGPGAWQIVALEAGGSAERRWQVRFSEHEAAEGVPYRLPTEIQIAEPGQSFDDGVEIQIRERTLNPTFRPTAFDLVAPQGFQVQTVACCPECQAPNPPPSP